MAKIQSIRITFLPLINFSININTKLLPTRQRDFEGIFLLKKNKSDKFFSFLRKFLFSNRNFCSKWYVFDFRLSFPSYDNTKLSEKSFINEKKIIQRKGSEHEILFDDEMEKLRVKDSRRRLKYCKFMPPRILQI